MNPRNFSFKNITKKITSTNVIRNIVGTLTFPQSNAFTQSKKPLAKEDLFKREIDLLNSEIEKFNALFSEKTGPTFTSACEDCSDIIKLAKYMDKVFVSLGKECTLLNEKIEAFKQKMGLSKLPEYKENDNEEEEKYYTYMQILNNTLSSIIARHLPEDRFYQLFKDNFLSTIKNKIDQCKNIDSKDETFKLKADINNIYEQCKPTCFFETISQQHPISEWETTIDRLQEDAIQKKEKEEALKEKEQKSIEAALQWNIEVEKHAKLEKAISEANIHDFLIEYKNIPIDQSNLTSLIKNHITKYIIGEKAYAQGEAAFKVYLDSLEQNNKEEKSTKTFISLAHIEQIKNTNNIQQLKAFILHYDEISQTSFQNPRYYKNQLLAELYEEVSDEQQKMICKIADEVMASPLFSRYFVYTPSILKEMMNKLHLMEQEQLQKEEQFEQARLAKKQKEMEEKQKVEEEQQREQQLVTQVNARQKTQEEQIEKKDITGLDECVAQTHTTTEEAPSEALSSVFPAFPPNIANDIRKPTQSVSDSKITVPNPNHNIKSGAKKSISQISGALPGALYFGGLGLLIGSIFPGLGNLIGLAIGVVIGACIGAIISSSKATSKTHKKLPCPVIQERTPSNEDSIEHKSQVQQIKTQSPLLSIRSPATCTEEFKTLAGKKLKHQVITTSYNTSSRQPFTSELKRYSILSTKQANTFPVKHHKESTSNYRVNV